MTTLTVFEKIKVEASFVIKKPSFLANEKRKKLVKSIGKKVKPIYYDNLSIGCTIYIVDTFCDDSEFFLLSYDVSSSYELVAIEDKYINEFNVSNPIEYVLTLKNNQTGLIEERHITMHNDLRHITADDLLFMTAFTL